MKNSTQVHARAVNKKAFTPEFKGVSATDVGLSCLLADKETGRLLVNAGDDREAVNVKAYPVGTPLLFPTGAYAVGDVAGGVLQAESLVGTAGKECLLESVRVVDSDNQGKAFDIILLSANPTNSTLTDNAAPNWSDLDTSKIVGFIRILGTDYIDIGSSIKVAQKVFPLPIRSDDTAGTVFVVVIMREAATYSNNPLKNVQIDLFVKQA